MRLVLVSFTLMLQLHMHYCSACYMRYSMIDLSLLHLTSEESLRDSEPPDISYWVPEHQGTGDFMRSQCMKLVLVSFKSTQLHVH